MRWRDVRFEKPTEADGDCHGEVVTVLYDGRKVAINWDSTDILDMAHFWCPMRELPDPPSRIPDPPAPPEGYQVATDADSYDAMIFYCPIDRKWKPVPAKSGRKIEPGWYAVPAKLQYRPYNAAELKQTIGKLVDGVSGYRAMITGVCGDSVYCQGQRVPSDQLLKNHTWTDGGRCGVKVE